MRIGKPESKDNPELSSKRKSNEPLFDLYMS